jgi:signal transduction histidine kinase
VVKHARRAEVSVRVKAGADGVRITVTDTGLGGVNFRTPG